MSIIFDKKLTYHPSKTAPIHCQWLLLTVQLTNMMIRPTLSFRKYSVFFFLRIWILRYSKSYSSVRGRALQPGTNSEAKIVHTPNKNTLAPNLVKIFPVCTMYSKCNSSYGEINYMLFFFNFLRN